MNAIEVDRLTKRFGGFAAVDGISFDVPEGQLLAVLGPNGAGKTTTLEILEGFTPPSSGTVRVLGADPHRGDRAWRARVGLVLQSTSLDAELAVHETIKLVAQLYPWPMRVREALDLVDLTDDANTKVGVLSGGQRRRVDLALGIVGRPDILFLDEPTTGLDPEARRRTWSTVENLIGMGTTVVLTTHYIEEADRLADRILVLSAGQVIADTTPQQLRASGGPPVVRYRMPDGTRLADLPVSLAHHVNGDGRTLVVRSTDVTGALRELVGWADREHLDLSQLEVGPPSLEEAYLNAIGQPIIPEVHAHD